MNVCPSSFVHSLSLELAPGLNMLLAPLNNHFKIKTVVFSNSEKGSLGSDYHFLAISGPA